MAEEKCELVICMMLTNTIKALGTAHVLAAGLYYKEQLVYM